MVVSVTGSSHRLCPPSRLQTWSAERENILAHLLQMQERGQVRGAVLLATCNRVELILDTEGPCPQLAELCPGLEPVPSHSHHCADAVEYLLRVACGLESLVLGEEQILGQLREAFKLAEQHRLLSPALGVLRSQLTAAARETRRQTGLCKTKVSVASFAARELLRHSRRCAVVGAGETGRLAAETLRRQGVEDLWIINRTRSRAENLAQHLGARAMDLESFLAGRRSGQLEAIDGALFAIHSEQPIMQAAHARGMRALVDISMPGVLSPCARDLTDTTILDLDRLGSRVAAEGARRDSASKLAEELIPGKARNLHQYLIEATTGQGKHLGKVLDLHVDTALSELHSALNSKLAHLSEADQEQLRKIVVRAARKNAHYHLQDLRQLSRP